MQRAHARRRVSRRRIMNLSEQIDKALDKYDMERSEEAEEIGKMVAGLQD
jgi:hypothetical protein